MSNLPLPTTKLWFDIDDGGVEADFRMVDHGIFTEYTATIGFGRQQIKLASPHLEHFREIIDSLQKDLMLVASGATVNRDHLCLGREACRECREAELDAQWEAFNR